MLLKPVIVIAAVLLCSCNGASIDGQAQEEHWDNTDSMHTSTPSESVQPALDTALNKTKVPGKYKGTEVDTHNTAVDPMYKSDNSDTAGKH